MNQVSFYALYSDGRKYQAVLEGDQTFVRTVDGGKMPVPLRIENGEFVEFGFDYSPEPRLRAGDVFENFGRFAKYVSRMTPPAKRQRRRSSRPNRIRPRYVCCLVNPANRNCHNCKEASVRM